MNNEEFNQAMERLYEGQNVAGKFKQPKDHSRIAYILPILGGVVWLIFAIYVWYLINS